MHAELLPLNHKYYGTIIKITDAKGFEYYITLWNDGSLEPSDRELNGICTIEQWRNNEQIIIDKETGETISAKEIIDIVDSHFESRETHAAALEMISRINKEYNTN